jgi:hypothetical protein
MHGQAIKMMQSFGLDKMAAYPYVRAAIIGHANKQSPQSCKLVKLCLFLLSGIRTIFPDPDPRPEPAKTGYGSETGTDLFDIKLGIVFANS